MCWKCENWRKSRTKCCYFCIHVFLSRVSGFPVASPCLWGKLANLSFSNVSKHVVLSFCVADVAVSDIPTCVITCGKCRNWRKSRTKCSFFLHPRVSSRVSGCPVASPCLWGKLGNLTIFECFQAGCPVVFAWQAWQFHDIPTCLINVWKNVKIGGSLARNARFFAPTCLVSSLWLSCGVRRVYGGSWKTLPFRMFISKQVVILFTLYTLHCSLHTPHFTLGHSLALFTPHSILYTLHFAISRSWLYTPHFTLHTFHSTLHTPHFYTLGWWSRLLYVVRVVMFYWLGFVRHIRPLLSFKILINIQRCRCPKRWIELVSRVY